MFISVPELVEAIDASSPTTSVAQAVRLGQKRSRHPAGGHLREQSLERSLGASKISGPGKRFG